MRFSTALYLIVIVSTGFPAFAQNARRSVNAAPAPAVGGKVTVERGPREIPPDLDMLIHMSAVIVDGTVSDVLPAVATNPNPDVPSAETFSVVTVNEVLSDIWMKKPSSLFVVQEGGKAGKWEVVDPGAPLVAKGERYIFFLDRDLRTAPFDTFGTPRYNAVGVWSGLVKVEDGKIQFLPKAVPELHKRDGMAATDFLGLVRARVDATVPKVQIIMRRWCPPSDPCVQ